MCDTQEQMFDLPYENNLREGLSLAEYIIPCHGDRKEVVDTTVQHQMLAIMPSEV